MPDYQAHVTDEWERDTMVIQVRRLATNGTTQAIAQVLEDTDGMPCIHWHQVDPNNYAGREHLVPTPGIRVPHDVAVAMARAILADAGKDADEVERLKGTLDTVVTDNAALTHEVAAQQARGDDLQNQVNALERLVEAKDAHLEREARVATLHVRVLEMGQADAEHEQAQRLHPARILQGGSLAGGMFTATMKRAADHEAEQERQRIIRGE